MPTLQVTNREHLGIVGRGGPFIDNFIWVQVDILKGYDSEAFIPKGFYFKGSCF